ncbi:MAG: hypothetical protein KQJ78_20195 [Deltaproteobacteria bacterium]|nr:hypothetical protein [Deltaproteobacteria bacterium]
MSEQRHEFQIKLTLESPFASQGLDAAYLGVDTHLARDHAGRLIIPGTLLRGVLRHLLLEMAGRMRNLAPGSEGPPLVNEIRVLEWFGQPTGTPWPQDEKDENSPTKPAPTAGDFTPGRSRVFFRDLVCQAEEPANADFLTRIEIDHATGSVQTGALQVVEQPFPLGLPVEFAGELAFYGSDAEAGVLQRALETALGFIPALGGVKSAGFGFLAAPATLVGSTETKSDPENAVPSGQGPWVFDLKILDPYLVDAERVALNIFQGQEVVPGAVIKGSLARLLELSGASDWKEVLQRMRLSHAIPLDSAGRRRRYDPPLTRYRCRNQPDRQGDLFDPQTSFEGLTEEVFFPVDWKWDGQGPDYHLRTRTAIKPGKETAQESQLFAYRLIKPGDKPLRFTLCFAPEDKDSPAAKVILAALVSGLDFLGKTSARARAAWQADAREERVVAPGGQDGETWRVVLQTPAALFGPEQCRADKAPDARALYLAYWRNLLGLWTAAGKPAPGKLAEEEFNFFAAQAWEGGYRAMRFPPSPGEYLPYILTKPGSVFLLRFTGGDQKHQKAFFEHLLRHGLPAYRADKLASPELWETCPYAPENGYGEVLVDWEDVVSLNPGGGHA